MATLSPIGRSLTDLTGHLRGFLRKRIYYLQDDIEDVVQEILLAVHNSRHTYRPDEPLTAWVHGIARYKLMDFFRARSRREALNDPLDDALEIFATLGRRTPPMPNVDVGKLLEQLPDRHRLPIVHVKLQGLSVTETAALTGDVGVGGQSMHSPRTESGWQQRFEAPHENRGPDFASIDRRDASRSTRVRAPLRTCNLTGRPRRARADGGDFRRTAGHRHGRAHAVLLGQACVSDIARRHGIVPGR